MSTSKVNRAVDEFRRLAKAEFKLEMDRDALSDQTDRLTPNEWSDYLDKTMAITDALEEAVDDAQLRGLKDSTVRQYVTTAVNRAGVDK